MHHCLLIFVHSSNFAWILKVSIVKRNYHFHLMCFFKTPSNMSCWGCMYEYCIYLYIICSIYINICIYIWIIWMYIVFYDVVFVYFYALLLAQLYFNFRQDAVLEIWWHARLYLPRATQIRIFSWHGGAMCNVMWLATQDSWLHNFSDVNMFKGSMKLVRFSGWPTRAWA